MKAILTILAFSISILSYSQISKREIPADPNIIFPYDSLDNMTAVKVSKYIGQEIVVLENYDLYTQLDGSEQTDSSIIEKSYTISNVTKSIKSINKLNIELTGGDGKKIYYLLSSGNLEHMSFIVKGFFAKQKQLYQGKKLKLKFDYEYTNLKSGQTRIYLENEQFTCIDAQYIVDRSKHIIPSLILRNTKGEEINVPLKGFEPEIGNNISRFIKL